ncbi:MAG: hypothetical protein J5928_02865 [Firmicutes bacterium]|nr:hypothetical protein [Bacillota bacterium]
MWKRYKNRSCHSFAPARALVFVARGKKAALPHGKVPKTALATGFAHARALVSVAKGKKAALPHGKVPKTALATGSPALFHNAKETIQKQTNQQLYHFQIVSYCFAAIPHL